MYDVPDLGLTPEGWLYPQNCGPDPMTSKEWERILALPDDEYKAAKDKWEIEVYHPWLECMGMRITRTRQ